jgi:hypothetical protein
MTKEGAVWFIRAKKKVDCTSFSSPFSNSLRSIFLWNTLRFQDDASRGSNKVTKTDFGTQSEEVAVEEIWQANWICAEETR